MVNNGYPAYLTVDGETSGATNGTYGNPFTRDNRLVIVGWGDSADQNSSQRVGEFSDALATAPAILLVGFNIKFDLHHLRRSGVCWTGIRGVWDCQLAEFIIGRQRTPLPSLEDVTAKYGIEGKYLDIKTDYWDKGIDTPDIPVDIVRRRVESDVSITSQLFELQWDYLADKPALKNLIWVACQDLLVLQEMEWNGLAYNLELSKEEGRVLEIEADEIKAKLTEIINVDEINWGSGDQLSAVLYGGSIAFDDVEKYVYTYRSGKRKGTTTIKQRNISRVVEFPRRVDPLPRSELKKEGYFSTDDGTLSKLRTKDPQTKQIIKSIQRLRELLKRIGTYYYGLPKLYEEMGWTDSLLHGNLNSCVAITGRLSSTKPNQQNMDHGIRKCIESRFQ